MPEQTDVVELTARMMELDSTSGREGALVDWVENYLAGDDWKTRRIPVTAGRVRGKGSAHEHDGGERMLTMQRVGEEECRRGLST